MAQHFQHPQRSPYGKALQSKALQSKTLQSGALPGKVLVFGSTVVDVVVKVPSLPSTAQDVNIISQHHQLGGCAYNVAHILQLAHLPHQLCSPVGCGVYGEFVARSLQEKNIPIFAQLPSIANGCCYCLVEPGGERTFLSHHGAEYLFQREWFTQQVLEGADSIYICGLELEEETSADLVAFLEEQSQLQIFFAPGPRITSISRDFLHRIFALSPILHLNEEEACGFTGTVTLQEALFQLHEKTGNDVIVTQGAEGSSCIHQGKIHFVPGKTATVVDTIGAGDAHIGTIIAALHLGMELPQALEVANAVSAAVVSVAGASLSKEAFQQATSSFFTAGNL